MTGYGFMKTIGGGQVRAALIVNSGSNCFHNRAFVSRTVISPHFDDLKEVDGPCLPNCAARVVA